MEDFKCICPMAEVNYLCLLRDLARSDPEELISENRLKYGTKFTKAEGEFTRDVDHYSLVLSKRGVMNPEGYTYGEYTEMVVWSTDPSEIGSIMTPVGLIHAMQEEVNDFMQIEGDYRLTQKPSFVILSERKMGHITKSQHLEAIISNGTYNWRSIINYCAGRTDDMDEKLNVLWGELRDRGIDRDDSNAHGILYEQLLNELQEKLREVGLIP